MTTRWILTLALLWLVGCVPGGGPNGDGVVLQPEIERSEAISTVATVRWSIEVETLVGAEVAFGRGAPDEFVAPAVEVAPGEFEAVLLGMKPNTTYQLQVSLTTDHDTFTSEVQEVTTGGVPTEIPQPLLDDDLHDPDLQAGGFVLTSFTPGPAVILDADGEVVWWHLPELDFVHTVNRLVLSEDRRSALYLVFTTRQHGGIDSHMRMLYRVTTAGELIETIDVPQAHHEFVELADGTIAILNYDARDQDGVEVAGERLTEVAPDGTERDVWSIWDHVPWNTDQQFEGGEVWGHCNTLRYEEDQDAYWLGSRNFSTLFQIDRETGDVLQRVGRTDPDYELVGDAEWFLNQHQFRLLDGGLLVFDNGVQAGTNTRVSEFALDEGSWEAERVWGYEPDPPMGVYAFGDVERLPDGNTLIAWGASGRIEEVTADGQIVKRLDISLGAASGYFEWMESLY